MAAQNAGYLRGPPADVGGTHKGLHRQEGVRIWPGGCVRRRAGL